MDGCSQYIRPRLVTWILDKIGDLWPEILTNLDFITYEDGVANRFIHIGVVKKRNIVDDYVQKPYQDDNQLQLKQIKAVPALLFVHNFSINVIINKLLSL